MKGDSPLDNSNSSRIPLTPLPARRLILKCFEEQDQWTRKDLATAVENRHRREGGYQGAQSPTQVVKKVLHELGEEGLVRSVSKGIWRYVKDSESATVDPIDLEPELTPSKEDDDSQEGDEPNGVQIKETIGVGEGSVYVYYNPNDFRLAQLEGRSTWECKVGYTVVEVNDRIIGQGVRTAVSHLPVIGLVIRSDEARTLEGILHRFLRLADATIVDAGPEWFMTSPDRIKNWYTRFEQALNSLKEESGFEVPHSDRA
jgi:hypothetical protein